MRDRLPAAYRTQPNGHEGSHQFLADDFVTACTRQTTPTVSVWDAARYNAPGIVAHQSALKGGELLNIPDYPKPADRHPPAIIPIEPTASHNAEASPSNPGGR